MRTGPQARRTRIRKFSKSCIPQALRLISLILRVSPSQEALDGKLGLPEDRMEVLDGVIHAADVRGKDEDPVETLELLPCMAFPVGFLVLLSGSEQNQEYLPIYIFAKNIIPRWESICNDIKGLKDGGQGRNRLCFGDTQASVRQTAAESEEKRERRTEMNRGHG